MEKLPLHKRFINGMFTKHGVSLEELNKKWRYAGGEENYHHGYFLMLCRDRRREGLPEYTKPKRECACVCGKGICENCYIRNDERFIVVGNCCIQKFMGEKRGRTCNTCGNLHKNRIVNRCNECRVGRCDICSDSCKETSKLCYACRNGIKRECENCGKLHQNKIVNRCDACRVGVCDNCGKKCRPCFEKCYTCAYLLKQ